MIDILKKYWWAVALIILAPVVINFVLQIPAFVQIVGDNTDWLTFWGNYLGGSIGALATLFVLFKTLQQNHEENEENRINQNNLAIFQVETNNLNLFKESCLILCDTYDYNRFVQICNSFIQESNSPLNLIKTGFSDVIKAKRLFLMNFMPSASKMRQLLDKENDIFKYYNSKLLDFEVVVSYQNLPKKYIKTHITADKHTSKSLALIIKKNIAQLDDLDSQKWLNKILNECLDEIPSNFIEPLWNLISDVYLSEKVRIAKFLVGYGTEQTK